MTNFSNYEISIIDKSWRSFHKNNKYDKNTIKDIRVAVYLRKSTEDIKDNSLKLQLSEIQKFLNSINIIYQNKYQFYYETADIFAEDNVSGMQGRLRPEFNKMLNIIESKSGYYGVCLVYKLDRFSRKLEDTLKYISLLKTYKCVLKALDFEDNGDPTSDLLRNILGVVAQYHAQNSALTSIKGTIKKVEENKSVGLLPYGLITEKNKLCDFSHKGASIILIDDEKANVVKLIFELFSNGYSVSDIKNYLKTNGYRKDNGDEFSWQLIYYMLRNSKYNGTYSYGNPDKKHYRKYDNGVKKPDFYQKTNAFPKIIDDELFNKVQVIINNKQNSHQLPIDRLQYLLTGIIYCSICQTKMTGWSRRKYKNKQYADYICKKHKLKDNQCPTKNINRNYIEEVVITIITNLLQVILANNYAHILLKLNSKVVKYENQIELTNKHIKNKQIQINKLIDLMLNDENNSKYYQEKITLLNSEINTLENKISNFNDIKNNQATILQKRINNFVINKELLLSNIPILKSLILEIFDRIEVSNDIIKIFLKSKKI